MIELILLCFGTASLSIFFDMCLQEGMIFYRYYKNIERLPVWIFKPLGGCVYCSGTWIFLIVYSCLIAEFSALIVLGIGINHVFIKAIERI
jgi:hypothetical protein